MKTKTWFAVWQSLAKTMKSGLNLMKVSLITTSSCYLVHNYGIQYLIHEARFTSLEASIHYNLNDDRVSEVMMRIMMIGYLGENPFYFLSSFLTLYLSTFLASQKHFLLFLILSQLERWEEESCASFSGFPFALNQKLI